MLQQAVPPYRGYRRSHGYQSGHPPDSVAALPHRLGVWSVWRLQTTGRADRWRRGSGEKGHRGHTGTLRRQARPLLGGRP